METESIGEISILASSGAISYSLGGDDGLSAFETGSWAFSPLGILLASPLSTLETSPFHGLLSAVSVLSEECF
jgi:hypothetical protein